MIRKRSIASLTLLVLIPLVFSACASKEASITKAGPGRMAELNMMKYDQDRSYVMTATQAVEVKEVEQAIKDVEAIVKKTGGLVQAQSVREDEHAHLTLRVPPGQLNPVLDALAALGTEESRSVSSEDVTERLIDTEARLKNAIALRDRLKALLGQAKDVKDVLEIEKELARLQGDIDSMEGRLKKLKEQVDFATVELTLERRKILGPLGYIVYGAAWLIKKLFVIQ
jgi:hypothetical protein